MISTILFDIPSILISVGIGIVTYVAYFYFKYFTRPNAIPGPIPLPFIGNLHQYPGDMSAFCETCQKKYGDIWEFYLGHPSDKTRGIGLGRADLLEKIYTTNLQECNFILRTPPNDGLDEFGSTSKGLLYNRNHDTWTYYRKFFNRAIMSPKFVRQAISWTEEIFEEVEGYWMKLGGDDEIELDLSQWLLRFTTDVIFRITTNKKTNALANYFNNKSPTEKINLDATVLKESEDFIKRVNDFITSMQYFLLTPKWLRYFPGGFKQTTMRLLKERDNMTKDLLQLVTQRREEINNTPLDVSLTPDMLTMFLTVNTDRDITEQIANESNTEPMSDEAIVGNFMEAAAGGIDTTAGTLCFISYCMARYPEAKKRLFEEIDSIITTNQKLTHENLNKLTYCDAVIKEVSRLLPVVDINYRMNTNDENLDGYTIPAETQFFINQRGINKHTFNWTNPEEFDPDRFINSQDKNLTFQFGGGARMCPLKAFMVLLYRKYDVELIENTPMKTHYTIVRHCDELKVRIKTRKF
ncbi:16901_t:CDS:2 [Funneliformis geosporum]|uniref:6780_t:CDS:1 n=1 Tax=Funneliformis geosporum TaxID=1117311 RepID=A0A9W4WPH9_9GLOM|nr:16901_t:CDS:2 [Funneliformis geosporum]CAI2177318.1 6780_t:CDS:2 [Funneliformis geosporum]